MFNKPLIGPVWAFWLLLGLAVLFGFLFPNTELFWLWFDRFLFGITGILGLLMLFLWLFSAYPATKWNLNILWTLPAPILLYVLVNTKYNEANKWRSMALMIAVIISLGILFLFIQQSIPATVLPVIVLMIYRVWIRFRYGNPGENLVNEPI